MTAAADTIWVGTESRNPDTRLFPTPRYGYVMPTEGYINYRWLTTVAGPKTGGAWFDSIDCTAQNYLDQAYQSVLAGRQRADAVQPRQPDADHPGQALLEAALPKLTELAEKVRGRPALRHFVLQAVGQRLRRKLLPDGLPGDVGPADRAGRQVPRRCAGDHARLARRGRARPGGRDEA